MPSARSPLVVLTLTLLAALPAALAAGLPAPAPTAPQHPTQALDGATWETRGSPSGAPTQGIGGNEHVLIASTWGRGTYRSTDNGVSWTEIPGFPVDEARVAWDPTDDDVGYVAGYGGLARTQDGGLTWTVPITQSPVQRIAVSPTGKVAVVAQQDFSPRIHVSTDHGATWTERPSPLGEFNSAYGIAFGPTDQHLAVMSIGRLYASSDDGTTWTETGPGGFDLATDASGALWLATFGRPQRSTDGGFTWSELVTPANFTGFGPRPGGGMFAVGYDGVYVTSDATNWINMGFDGIAWAATDLFTDPTDPAAVFLTDENVGVSRIAPNGQGGFSLEGRSSGFPPVRLNGVAGAADGSVLLAPADLGLYASKDGGYTWSHTGAGTGLNGAHSAGAAFDGSVLYAGGQSMIFQPWAQASKDGGKTWTSTAMDMSDGRTVAFANHPSEPQTAWAAVRSDLGNSLLKATTNGGDTWSTLYITPDRILDVAYANGRLLAATDAGVVAVDPATGVGTPILPSPFGSNAIAAHATRAYAHGPGVSLWATLPGIPVFTPFASAGAVVTDLAADAGGAWSVGSGAIQRCTATGGALGACTNANVDGFAVGIAAVAGETWAATQDNGLFVRAP